MTEIIRAEFNRAENNWAKSSKLKRNKRGEEGRAGKSVKMRATNDIG